MTTLRAENNVVFGTGPLGLSVMDELVARGRQVMLVNRRGSVAEGLPAGVTVTQGDATNPDSVAAVSAGADVVFHCAQPAYHEWVEKFPPITRGIVEGLARLNTDGARPRLVMGDNLYMYGPHHGASIHEALPYAATDRKGRTRAAMATFVLDAHREGRIVAAIGRAADFYGPRVTGSAVGELFFEPALVGRPINVMGNPSLPHTYTYIHDFARGLVTLSEHEAAFGRAWHVPSAPTVSTRHFAEMVGQATGQPVKLRVAGPLLMTLAGLFSPEAREMKEMMYEFVEPFVVDDSDFRATFKGMAGPTPHQTAIRETVAWYRTRVKQAQDQKHPLSSPSPHPG